MKAEITSPELFDSRGGIRLDRLHAVLAERDQLRAALKEGMELTIKTMAGFIGPEDEEYQAWLDTCRHALSGNSSSASEEEA